MIFFNSISDKAIWHKFIEAETRQEYQQGLDFLLNKGFEIQSVSIDGRRGIPQVFNQYLVQVCQFHVQISILIKTIKTTLNPRSDCGMRLK